MPSQSRSPWNAARFVSTLNYFGEVPFLGSFRWMQQLLGQSPNVPGVAMSAVNKRVVAISDHSPNLIDVLRKQLPSSIDLISSEAAHETADASGLYDQANTQSSELPQLIRSVDSLVVVQPSELLSLWEDLGSLVDDFLGIGGKPVERCVFNFSDPGFDLSAWGALDDVVMGGISQGSFFLRDRQAVFAGNVSTDNSGGFSSVRTRNFEPPFDLSGWKGMRLRVKGDGQRYKFILRNSGGWDSPAYIYSFDTVADTWMDVNVPFDELVATFRARSVADAQPFDAQQIFSVQLMLSKFEYDRQLNPSFKPGSFELAVRSINVYRSRKGVPLIVVGSQDAGERSRQQAMLNEAQIDYRLIEPGETELAEAIAQALTQAK